MKKEGNRWMTTRLMVKQANVVFVKTKSNKDEKRTKQGNDKKYKRKPKNKKIRVEKRARNEQMK